jgi:hypothetical protein
MESHHAAISGQYIMLWAQFGLASLMASALEQKSPHTQSAAVASSEPFWETLDGHVGAAAVLERCLSGAQMADEPSLVWWASGAEHLRRFCICTMETLCRHDAHLPISSYRYLRTLPIIQSRAVGLLEDVSASSADHVESVEGTEQWLADAPRQSVENAVASITHSFRALETEHTHHHDEPQAENAEPMPEAAGGPAAEPKKAKYNSKAALLASEEVKKLFESGKGGAVNPLIAAQTQLDRVMVRLSELAKHGAAGAAEVVQERRLCESLIDSAMAAMSTSNGLRQNLSDNFALAEDLKRSTQQAVGVLRQQYGVGGEAGGGEDTFYISTIAGTGLAGGFKDGPARNATFNQPHAAVELYDGSILIAETKNSSLRLLRADGVVETVVGRLGPGRVDGPIRYEIERLRAQPRGVMAPVEVPEVPAAPRAKGSSDKGEGKVQASPSPGDVV